MRALLRYRLRRLERKLADAVARQMDVADALTRANERNVEPLEEDRIRACFRVVNLKAAIKRIEAKLARPPLLWWVTAAGRHKKQFADGYAYGQKKLETNHPDVALTFGVGLSAYSGDAAHNEGVRAAVMDHLEVLARRRS